MFGTTKKKHSDDSDEEDEDEDGSEEDSEEEKKDGDSSEKDTVRFLKGEAMWRNSRRDGVKKKRKRERNCCLTFTEASKRLIRDGYKWGKGGRRVNQVNQGCHGPPPEQQDVMAVCVWHSTATTAPCSCCPNRHAEQSHNVHSSAVGKEEKRKKTCSSFHTWF